MCLPFMEGRVQDGAAVVLLRFRDGSLEVNGWRTGGEQVVERTAKIPKAGSRNCPFWHWWSLGGHQQARMQRAHARGIGIIFSHQTHARTRGDC